jgi:hypothetical protein
MHRKIAYLVCHVMFFVSNSCQKTRHHWYGGQFTAEKSRRLTRYPRRRMHANIVRFTPCHRFVVVAIFLIENDLDLYMDGFPFGPSHTKFYSFLVFFFSVFPTQKSHTRPTSINQTTYSDRRFVYINNIYIYVHTYSISDFS